MLASLPIALAALFFAALALVIAIVALQRSAPSRAAGPARASSQAARPSAGPRSAPTSQKAYVRVALVGTGRTHRVVVANLGPATAREVTLSVEAETGRASPMVQADCDEQLPISELPAGSEVALLATVSSASGSRFAARLVWINADGSREGSTTTIEAP